MKQLIRIKPERRWLYMEVNAIRDFLQDETCSYISDFDKIFICEFTNAMNTLGYHCEGKIVDGVCFGRHMMIFRKINAKSRKVYARLYLRTNGVVVRFFFSDVSFHSEYILTSPSFIKNTFIDDYAKCTHCHGDVCKFRKSYRIADQDYEKCNGLTFEFFEPTLSKLDFYRDLFLQFYPVKR
jgi:hypothetical protein